MGKHEVATALSLSLAGTGSLQVDALAVVLPAGRHCRLAVATPSVKAGTVEENVVTLLVLLQLRQVVLLILDDLSHSSLGHGSLLGLLLAVFTCFTVTITLLSSAARCHQGNGCRK